MRTRMLAFTICTVLAATNAHAHGPQMQVTNDNNKIVTRQIIPTAPYGDSLTAEKSVYLMPILKAVSGSPTTDFWTIMPNSSINPILQSSSFQFGPGLAYGIGHTFADGQHFNVNFTSPLERWNGASFVTNPGPEEIGAFRGDATAPADTAFTTDSSPFQGLVFGNISSSYNGESHSSMRFRMLGNGTSALEEPADGIYLLQLQITSTQANLSPSDVFSFVLYKNATDNALAAAVRSLGVNSERVQFVSVPEPAGITLAAIGLIALVVRYKRGRRVIA